MAKFNALDYVEIEKAKDLVSVKDPVRYMTGSEIDYELLSSCIEEQLEQYGVPFALKMGKISYGMFSGDVEALYLVNPEKYDDYYKFVIFIRRQGKTCTIEVFSCGKSTQMSAEAFAQSTKIFDGGGTLGTAAGVLRGGAVGAGFAVGSAVGGMARAGVKAVRKGLNAMIRDQQELEEEQGWYDIIFEVLYSVIA